MTCLCSGREDKGDFSLTQNCPSLLPANASCIVSVTFAPQKRGNKTAVLTVTDNASGSPQTVSLGGTGVVPPPLTQFPSGLNFGSQLVGTTSNPQTVTV